MSAVAGYYGKIPNRGDFIRYGLPQSFLGALDSWWQTVLSESRSLLGEGWVDAWMEAPLWRFALAEGCCGAGAAIGLWVPSVDKAGRLFPLTLAMVGESWRDVEDYGAFLDAAAGLAITSVEQDVTPDWLASAVGTAAQPGGQPLQQPAPRSGRWWTEGSPLVAAAELTVLDMPSYHAFAGMLRDR